MEHDAGFGGSGVSGGDGGGGGVVVAVVSVVGAVVVVDIVAAVVFYCCGWVPGTDMYVRESLVCLPPSFLLSMLRCGAVQCGPVSAMKVRA